MICLLAISLVTSALSSTETQLHSTNTLDHYFDLSEEDLLKIGEIVWYHESDHQLDRLDLLTFWNEAEPFPSLGIGHFIWPSESYEGVFAKGRFHFFLKFLTEHDIPLPAWLQQARYCPWKTRNEFYASFDSEQMNELRAVLIKTNREQVLFMLETLKEFCNELIQKLPDDSVALEHLKKLLSSPQGLFILVDYLNFKGSGTGGGNNLSAQYQGKRWGLLQVLEIMDLSQDWSLEEAFSLAAKTLLQQRVLNSPNPKAEARWLPIWFERIDSYTRSTSKAPKSWSS